MNHWSRKFLPATLALVLAGSIVVVATPVSAAASCFGEAATIVGKNRDPSTQVVLNGTSGNDVIVGLEGWDFIAGRGGNDLICSGGADDYVKAGDGRDKVDGQEGLDTVFGGAGDDLLRGGRGGGDGLLGGRGDDHLLGGVGTQDSLVGGPGNDVMDGGPGYDLAEFWDAPAGIEVDLRTGTATGHGQDRVTSVEGLVGSRFGDVLFGDDLSNMLQGGGGNDVIHALGSAADGGMDILRSAEGDALLDGGDGPDIASYNVTPWAVTADLATGTATKDQYGTDTLVAIEHLVGSKENDTLVGDEGDNLIIGNRGDDVMDGGGGTDEAAFVDAGGPVIADLGAGTATAVGWGSDTFVNFENLTGSVWADELIGDGGPNTIWGGSRGDSIRGLAGDDVLVGEGGADELNGGPGTDECDGETELDCEVDPAPLGLQNDPFGELAADATRQAPGTLRFRRLFQAQQRR